MTKPADSALLVDAVELHEERLGYVPRIVAADAGFYSQAYKPMRSNWRKCA